MNKYVYPLLIIIVGGLFGFFILYNVIFPPKQTPDFDTQSASIENNFDNRVAIPTSSLTVVSISPQIITITPPKPIPPPTQQSKKVNSDIPIAIPTPVITQSVPSTTPSIVSPDVKEREITLEAVVSLACYFNSSDESLHYRMRISGSGVIISPDGYILTARHIVDQQYTAWAYQETLTKEQIHDHSILTLDYCEVGTPSIRADRIKAVEVSYMKPPYQFIAHPIFVPSQNNLSEYEEKFLDFAILKIDGLNPQFSTYSPIYKLPDNFLYNQFLNELPAIGENIVSYTYPALYAGLYNRPDEYISLRRHEGKILKYHTIDSNENMLFDLSSDSEYPGSSGGPVFFKGHLIGIIISGETNVFHRAVSMPTIIKFFRPFLLTP